MYRARFMTEEQLTEMINLWHLSKVPFSDFKGPAFQKRIHRMAWTASEMHKKYPGISENGAYKDLSAALEWS